MTLSSEDCECYQRLYKYIIIRRSTYHLTVHPFSIQNDYINLKLDYIIDKLDLSHDHNDRCKTY